MARRKTPTVFIVSDGRGKTCEQLFKAALLQFEGQPYHVVRRPQVRSAKAVQQILEKAGDVGGVVFYTLVGDETRRRMSEGSREMLVPTVDVLGPSFSALHDLFKRLPTAKPGLLYASEREDFDRHEAIDYTLKHDDGQRPHELGRADVVLVGVSRASKSSTCFYLAYHGIKAANVPLVPGVPPLPQLTRLPPEKVIGLRMNVMRLLTVRETRAINLGLAPDNIYLDKRTVAREVLETSQVMERHGWFCFDASYMAIEEIAREVIKLRRLKIHARA